MKYLIRIAILICCLGCSGEPGKPPPSGTPDQTAPRQSAAVVGSPGAPGAQPAGDATSTHSHLSPERWTASVFGAPGGATSDVHVSLQNQALTFVSDRDVGRVDFHYDRLLEGDFHIIAQIHVQSDMTARPHMGPTVTNAWVQVTSADGPRRRAAVPVNLPHASSSAEIEIVRTGEQIRCLCNGQQMGGGRFGTSAQFGLWINGPGQISFDELRIQATGLMQIPTNDASGLAGDANLTDGTTAGTLRTSDALVSFEDWEVPRSGPGYLLDAMADAVDLSRDSQGIRFAHASSGPHVSVRWKPPLSGNFRATLRLVLPAKTESKWGAIYLQVMPASGSGKMIAIPLPSPEADQPRECTVYVERYDSRLTCRIDGGDEASVIDISGPVGLNLLLTGNVHCWLAGINTEELLQLPPSLLAMEEEPPERKEPTAPSIVGQRVVSQRLPARVDEVIVGGAGRFLVLRFNRLNKLGLFDIEAGEITETMPLKGLPLLAAGLDSLVTIDPETGIICRYNLSDLTLEATSMLSLRSRPLGMALGAASAGPVWIVAPGGSGPNVYAIDLRTLSPMDLPIDHVDIGKWSGSQRVAVSADGQVVAIAGQPACLLAPTEEGWVSFSHRSLATALPDAAGSLVFTEQGILSRQLKPISSGDGPPVTNAVPAIDAPLYLTVDVSNSAEETPVRGTVVLHRQPGTDPIARFDDLQADVGSASTGSGGLSLEQRVTFHARSGTIAIVAGADDRVLLKRFDLKKLLDDSAGDFVLVVSQAPPTAKPSEVYRYQLEALSSGPGVQYELASAAVGMAVAEDGLLSWQVPEERAGSVERVNVTVRSQNGATTRHSFPIQVLDEIPAEIVSLIQEPMPQGVVVEPKRFGIELPPGPVAPGSGQRVVTHDEDHRPIVGRVYLNVGDNRVVLLPDGALVVRSRIESPLTDRRFVPATGRQALQQLQARFPGARTRESRHYVYAYNTSDKFFFGTMRILETMLPGVARFAQEQGLEIHAPECPLAVVMFRTEEEFRKFARMPTGVVAYYDTLTNHIVMYEESPLWKIKPELALREAISTIAHEGTHQILHNIGVQQRLSRWPMWLSEGLAEYLAPTSFGKELSWKGAGEVNDMRMFELEMYLKGREADTPDGQMIEHTVAAASLTSTGYASAWALTHHLAKNQAASFAQHLREVSRLGPFRTLGDAGSAVTNMALFRKHFDGELPGMEAVLVQHLRELPYVDPFVEWPHWGAFVALPDGNGFKRYANIFHTPGLAEKWVGDTLSAATAKQKVGAKTAVRQFPNRIAAERYAQQFRGN